jgi:hypothetical protein
MPIDDRDYVRGAHPPNCTCVECTKRRLEELQKRNRQTARVRPIASIRHRRRITLSTVIRYIKTTSNGLIGLVIIAVRTSLVLVSLCSGILGAHGLYLYILGTDSVTSANWDKLFLVWSTPVSAINEVVEGVTRHSLESIILPVVLIIVAVVVMITQATIRKRPIRQNARGHSLARISPWGMLFAVVGVVIIGYTISNWDSMNQEIAILVIAANAVAVLWNLSAIFR